jgi:predicted phosphodiesterase
MRTAILSDTHGNLAALEAVLADLRLASPDLIVHGGDVADGGASPVEVLDRVRELGWPVVMGNTDEMLAVPDAFETFAAQSPHLQTLWQAIREMAAATRDRLGDDRLAWLRALPRTWMLDPVTVVHATPGSCWRAPAPEAPDADLAAAYGPLGTPIVVYGHVHRPFVRTLAGLTVANSGSVSLSYDGDRRASYLLVDDGRASIRRVEYDVDAEVDRLRRCGLPHADWMARTLADARPGMP